MFPFSILAVGYEARKFGISRMLRGDEAKEKCPDIILFHVPEKRGKADLTKYRLAGAEVYICVCIGFVNSGVYKAIQQNLSNPTPL